MAKNKKQNQQGAAAAPAAAQPPTPPPAAPQAQSNWSLPAIAAAIAGVAAILSSQPTRRVAGAAVNFAGATLNAGAAVVQNVGQIAWLKFMRWAYVFCLMMVFTAVMMIAAFIYQAPVVWVLCCIVFAVFFLVLFIAAREISSAAQNAATALPQNHWSNRVVNGFLPGMHHSQYWQLGLAASYFLTLAIVFGLFPVLMTASAAVFTGVIIVISLQYAIIGMLTNRHTFTPFWALFGTSCLALFIFILSWFDWSHGLVNNIVQGANLAHQGTIRATEPVTSASVEARGRRLHDATVTRMEESVKADIDRCEAQLALIPIDSDAGRQKYAECQKLRAEGQKKVADIKAAYEPTPTPPPAGKGGGISLPIPPATTPPAASAPAPATSSGPPSSTSGSGGNYKVSLNVADEPYTSNITIGDNCTLTVRVSGNVVIDPTIENVGPQSRHLTIASRRDPNGFPNPAGWLGQLLVKINGVIYAIPGTSANIKVLKGGTVAFLINDRSGYYSDNVGHYAIDVEIKP